MTAALLIAIFFLAFFVQATLGFGATILALSLASLLLPISVVLPPLILIDVLECLWVLWRFRDGVEWRTLLRGVIPPAAVGMPIGMVLFRLGEDQTLKLVFGVAVMGLALFELWRLRTRKGPAPLGRRPAAGFLFGAGFTHGLYGCGGPMAVYVVSRWIEDKYRFRSTMHALWLLLDAALLVGFALGGELDGPTWRWTALLLLPAATGVGAGVLAHPRIDARLFRGLVYGLLLAAGTVLAITSI